MPDYTKLDKIEVTEEEVFKIIEWVGKNRDKYRVANPILNEGVIVYTDSDTNIYFKVLSESAIHFECSVLIDKAKEPFKTKMSFDIRNSIYRITSLFGEPVKSNYGWSIASNFKYNGALFDKANEEQLEELKNMTVEMCKDSFFNIMTYAQFYREYVTSTTHKVNKSSKNKSTGKKNSKVKLTKVYRLNISNANLDKREFARHTEYWTVQGHWRHYKSGKTVWINPFSKGDKSKKQGKIYKI